MKENIKQHFVPQYYLRNFASDGILNVFDMETKRTFTNSPNNLAYKKYCYEINPSLLNQFMLDEVLVDSKFVDDIIRKYNEDLLAIFINSFNAPAERLKKGDLRDTISVVDMHSLFDFALVQLFRNPKYFNLGTWVKNDLKDKFHTNFSQIDNLENTINGIELLVLMSTVFYNTNIKFKNEFSERLNPLRKKFEILKDDLSNSYTILYMNSTTKKFICSDSPIGIKMNFDNEEMTFHLISIPINPQIAFICINRRLNKKLENAKSGTKLLTESNIQELININLMTTYSSKRFLYSEKNDFSDELAFINGETKLKLVV